MTKDWFLANICVDKWLMCWYLVDVSVDKMLMLFLRLIICWYFVDKWLMFCWYFPKVLMFWWYFVSPPFVKEHQKWAIFSAKIRQNGCFWPNFVGWHYCRSFATAFFYTTYCLNCLTCLVWNYRNCLNIVWNPGY